MKQNISQAIETTFPFILLMYWIKVYAPAGERCTSCGDGATYSADIYFDVGEQLRLLACGVSKTDATDQIWEKALSEQLRGKHTSYLRTYHCRECTLRLVAGAVGESTAKVALLPTALLGDLSSLIVGCRLATREDPGKPFAGCVVARTLDELIWQLKQEMLSLRVKG